MIFSLVAGWPKEMIAFTGHLHRQEAQLQEGERDVTSFQIHHYYQSSPIRILIFHHIRLIRWILLSSKVTEQYYSRRRSQNDTEQAKECFECLFCLTPPGGRSQTRMLSPKWIIEPAQWLWIIGTALFKAFMLLDLQMLTQAAKCKFSWLE